MPPISSARRSDGERRLFRRLHHHGIAGRDGSADFSGAEHERMVERDDAPDYAARLAHREIDDARSHRDRGAFHLRHQAGVEVDLRRRNGRIHDHLVHRIAAIGGVDHRQLLGVLAQHVGDTLEQPRALEWRRVAPAVEGLFGRADRGLDIRGVAIGEGTKRLAGARIDRIDIAAGFRLVPFAAIEGVAMLGQMQRHGLEAFWRNSGVHDRFLCASSAFRAGHCRGHAGGIAGLDADIDDGNLAGVDRGDRLFQNARQDRPAW